MKRYDPNSSSTLGVDLRSLRKARGKTLQELSEEIGKSVGWVSQVERDKSQPSVSDLRDFAQALNVPISMLFGQSPSPAEESGYIVRQSSRRAIGSNKAGLIEELLSPDLTDDFEVVHSTFEPGAHLPKPQARPTQELGYVITGKLDLTIAGHNFTVGSGDSFRIRGEIHQWSNPYDDPCVVIWVIAPPVY